MRKLSPRLRVAAALIIAPPGQAKLDAIVVIEDAEAVADRLEPVGDRQRILLPAGEVDHGRAEDRPIAGEADPPAEPDLLAVAQILDRRIDVPVEPQIADRGIGPQAADDGVDLVAAQRHAVLVDAEAVGEADEAADAQVAAADEIGEAPRQAGARRQDRRPAIEAVALADRRAERDAGQIHRPVGAVGDAHAVFPAVVAGESVQREEVRILEVDRTGILVGDVHILGRRRSDEREGAG